MQLCLVLYQVVLKRLLSRLELTPICLRLIQQDLLQVQKLVWVEILKRGSWSHHSAWQRFYNEHIIQKGHAFQDMVYKESGEN